MPRRSGRSLSHRTLNELARDAEQIIDRARHDANLRRRVVEHKKRRSGRRTVRHPAVWEKRPGEVGFNAYAHKVMTKAGVLEDGDDVRCVGPDDSPYDQPYQRTVAFLAHPKSTPDYRLLVAHRTGAGKTLTMIRVLGNFYADPRPKLVIFPTATVRRQFYRELLAFANPFREYALRETGLDPGRASRRELTTAEMDHVVKALALHGPLLKRANTAGYPAAPLRAFSYNEIGSAALRSMRWAQPGPGCTAMADGSANLFCDKIVVMDEAHNLIKPDEARFKLEVSRANLTYARDALARATRTVLLLLTATPMVDDPADVDALLAVVKGHGNEQLTDEGFVSAYYDAPTSAYPAVEPREREVPRVVRVELGGDPDDKSTALGSYLDKLLDRENRPKPAFRAAASRDVYDYTAAHPSYQTRPPFSTAIRGKRAAEVAPKLWRAAEYVAEASGKVIVLTAKRHGFFALATLLREHPAFAEVSAAALLGAGVSTTRADWHPVRSERETLARFNAADNADGGKLKALVLNADTFSEGVDFKDVQHVVLLDVSPKWAVVLQRVGRAVRHCSAARLPPAQRKVHTVLLVASLPAYARRKTGVVDLRHITTDDDNVLKVIHDRGVIQRRMCRLMDNAVDARLLGTAACGGRAGRAGPVPLGAADAKELDACDRRHHGCMRKALREFGWRDTELLAKATALCSEEREACREATTGPARRFESQNCPHGYGFKQCVYHCRHELGLSGVALGRCIARRNSGATASPRPRRRRSGSAAPPAEGCPVCPPGTPAGKCASHCTDLGLTGIDLYRCMAGGDGADAAPCVGPRVDKPVAPSPAKPPAGKVLNPKTGRLIQAGGPTHRRLCAEGVVVDGCLAAAATAALKPVKRAAKAAVKTAATTAVKTAAAHATKEIIGRTKRPSGRRRPSSSSVSSPSSNSNSSSSPIRHRRRLGGRRIILSSSSEE